MGMKIEGLATAPDPAEPLVGLYRQWFALHVLEADGQAERIDRDLVARLYKEVETLEGQCLPTEVEAAYRVASGEPLTTSM
jgi:hypothetical protein